MTALRARGVRVRYGSTAVVDGVDLDVVAGEVLALAGLGDDPAIRPASITAVAGVQAFEATRSIEAAAVRLGLGSLDSAARAIAWNWQVR